MCLFEYLGEEKIMEFPVHCEFLEFLYGFAFNMRGNDDIIMICKKRNVQFSSIRISFSRRTRRRKTIAYID